VPSVTIRGDEEEARGEIRVRDGAVRDRLRQPAEKRIGAERHDQGRQPQRGDERGVQSAGQRADAERQHDGHRDCQTAIEPEFAEGDGAQAQQGTHRKIDAGGEDHRREREREQADFAGVTQDVELPVERAEADGHAAAVRARAEIIEQQPLHD
jgi:hypothetical protein